ncbi:hypothetical protein L873DRAFT_1881955 [Choiromyces venosus 120613-1]|uniref:Uncharacterized protein n=1 Tax=Choiromyces venosus 120613-1 TaxID=1336337 RepID=A0A3N4J870_9PEZI|nr:hypothetical protein L873DRAFT_1881955 [Choiromyces venosus 120613-1]
MDSESLGTLMLSHINNRDLVISQTGSSLGSLYPVNLYDWPGATSSSPSNLFEKQDLSIPQMFEYRSPGEPVKIITMTVDFDSAVQSFLYFHSIIEHDFNMIEMQLQLLQWRSAHFTFENSLNAAMLQIMPGPEHEIVSVDLYPKILMKIASIPRYSEDMIAGVGAVQFQVPGAQSKGTRTYSLLLSRGEKLGLHS